MYWKERPKCFFIASLFLRKSVRPFPVFLATGYSSTSARNLDQLFAIFPNAKMSKKIENIEFI
jgi:hypothetical protein